MNKATARGALASSRSIDGVLLSRALALLASLLLLLCPPAAGDVSVWLYPDTLCVGPGETFDLYLWIDEESGGFNGYEGVVRFDPAVLEFVSVQEESLMTDLCHNTWWAPEIGDSTVFFSHVALCSGQAVTGPGALSSITFEAPATTQTSPVTFDNIEFYYAGNPDTSVTAHDGLVVISPDCPASGSCCLADGSCLVATPDECSGLGGVFLHFLEDCTPNPCPQPAVCCVGDDCLILLEEADCAAAGGMWVEELDSCDPNPCPAMGANEPSPTGRAPRLAIVPSPAARETVLEYRLDAPGHVRLEILDANGRLVRTLLDGRVARPQGTAQWAGCNERGERVTPGIYFARISADAEGVVRRLVYLD